MRPIERPHLFRGLRDLRVLRG